MSTRFELCRAAALACALAGNVALAGEGSDSASSRSAGMVAGGEVELSWPSAIDSLSAEIGYVPVTCELDVNHKQAKCPIPTTLGPGTWPLDVEIGHDGRYARARHLLDLRVPAVVRTSHWLVAPGDTIELELEAPIPAGEELEVIFRGPRLDSTVKPQQLLSSRLRVRVPMRSPAEAPLIVLRVRDVESAPFVGVAVKGWMRWVRGWTAFASAGVVIGAVAAVLVVITQPAKLRR